MKQIHGFGLQPKILIGDFGKDFPAPSLAVSDHIGRSGCGRRQPFVKIIPNLVIVAVVVG